MSVGGALGPIPTSDGVTPPAELTVVDVSGVGRAAGRGYGEACRPLIRQHLEQVLERLASCRGLGRDVVFERALPYRDAPRAEQP